MLIPLPDDGSIVDVGIDFETYYDDDYSLKKLENSAYVMDPRFEIIGVGICYNGQKEWISGTLSEIHAQLSELPWNRIRVVAHNARFEASILEWRLGIAPHSYLCTMVGSRAHFVPFAGGQSLAAISTHFGVGKKGDYVGKVAGMHRSDFDPVQLADYGSYCTQDAYLGWRIGERLSTVLPVPEQELIDLTIKKYARPTLSLDKNYLVTRLSEIQLENRERVRALKEGHGVDADDIRSRPKFAVLLNEALAPFNQKPPTKRKKPTKANPQGGTTYAFAKDDVEFKALLAHPDARVRALVQAKLDFSSSMEESRITRLIDMHDLLSGKLAVPLVYYGAHTGRFSGDEKINVQNLPRVERDKATGRIKKGHLRFAVVASPGYSIVAADFSNIEARIVATLAREMALVEGFRRGEDIYSYFASIIYGYAVKKDTHPKERFVGKTCILGLGYGMGYKKFHLKMMQEGIIMTEAEASRIVRVYRQTYPRIPALWKSLESAAAQFITDPAGMFPITGGMVLAHQRIILPNGMPIVYPGLSNGHSGLTFRSRYGAQNLMPERGPAETATLIADVRQNIWGGAFTENIAQALARIVATTAELKLAHYGLIAPLQVHDELVFHVPTVLVPRVKPVIESIMTEVVEWLPDLPVAVEIHDGPTYGDAK